MYEAKFLMGALAGLFAENHRIGYRADYPLYGTIAGINAFAIGASMTDPLATVHLAWATKEGTNWQSELLEKDIHVFSGLDMIRPETASREYGLFRKQSDGRVQNLAAPLWDWGRYYALLLGILLHGSHRMARTDQAVNYWYGMSAGVIDVILSHDLPTGSVRLVEALKNGIISGSLLPFSGELRSQDGLIRKAGEPLLSDREIVAMNWLNENIVGHIPVFEELQERSRNLVRLLGIYRDSIPPEPAGETP